MTEDQDPWERDCGEPDCRNRATCPYQGNPGHYQCGICPVHRRPRHHCDSYCMILEPEKEEGDDA